MYKKLLKILLENKSVSDDVQFYLDNIVDKINVEFNNPNNQWVNIEKIYKEPNEFVYTKQTFNVKNIILENIEGLNKLYVNFINFNNREEYNKFYNCFEFRGEYNSQYKTIALTIPCINNNYSVRVLKRLLSHELLHYYRFLLGGKNNDKLYNICYNIMHNSIYSNDSIVYKISITVYWLNTEEILANSQAIYNECISSKLRTLKDIKENSDLYKELIQVKTNIREIKEYLKTNKIPLVFKKITKKFILNYLTKQYNYALDKFKHSIQRVIDDSQHINESFRSCSHTIISNKPMTL